MKEQHVCPTCGVTSNKYWHRVSPGMIEALVKFRRAIKEQGKNDLHIYQDLTGENELSTVQQMNWTKLRFHGLVAKVSEDGERKQGHWLLTSRGRRFLDGELSIPLRVQTLNNRVIDHDEHMVYVRDVLKFQPWFDDWNYWHGTKEGVPIHDVQTELSL